MKILTVDIGTRNLAWCMIDSTKLQDYIQEKSNSCGIIKWGKTDLIENFIHYCEHYIEKANKRCKAKAKWQARIKNGKYIMKPLYVCGRHLDKKNIKMYKPYKQKTTKNFKRIEIHNLLLDWLESKKEWLIDVNKVYIELQMTRNPSMKMIAHVMYTWFLIQKRILNSKQCLQVISFMSAKYKLQNDVYNLLKDNRPNLKKKKVRKDESVRLCLKLLKRDKRKYKFLSHHSKKDDLCDTLLMCIKQL